MPVCQTQATMIAVEDIKKVQEVIARENKQLVYAHFNLIDGEVHKMLIFRSAPTIWRMPLVGWASISQASLQPVGTVCQLISLVTAIPPTPDYDRFLTLGDAATCSHVQREDSVIVRTPH